MVERVQPGERPKADHVNRIVDAVNRFNAQSLPESGMGAVEDGPGSVLGWVYNSDTTPVEPLQVLVVRAQIAGYGHPVVLACGTFSTGELPERMVVVLDRLLPGQVGRAVISGIGWVRYNGDINQPYGTLLPGGRSLTMGAAGVALVLGRDPSNALVLVRFPVGGGSGGTIAASLTPHSHQGYYDGGFLNSLTGGL